MIGNGVLYFNGEPIKDLPKVTLETQEHYDNSFYVMGLDISNGVDFTGYFNTRISRNDYLSIVYGRRITNNWLKIHGGVMSRRRKVK